jgi:hypothetical protein
VTDDDVIYHRGRAGGRAGLLRLPAGWKADGACGPVAPRERIGGVAFVHGARATPCAHTRTRMRTSAAPAVAGGARRGGGARARGQGAAGGAGGGAGGVGVLHCARHRRGRRAAPHRSAGAASGAGAGWRGGGACGARAVGRRGLRCLCGGGGGLVATGWTALQASTPAYYDRFKK